MPFDKPSLKFANQFFGEFAKLRKIGHFCDLILMTDEQKPILCHSIVFRICCNGNVWKNSLKNLMLSQNDLDNLLSFLYTGKFKRTEKDAKMLHRILKEIDLKENFLNLLSDEISKGNWRDEAIEETNFLQDTEESEIVERIQPDSKESQAEIVYVSMNDYAPGLLNFSARKVTETQKKYQSMFEQISENRQSTARKIPMEVFTDLQIASETDKEHEKSDVQYQTRLEKILREETEENDSDTSITIPTKKSKVSVKWTPNLNEKIQLKQKETSIPPKGFKAVEYIVEKDGMKRKVIKYTCKFCNATQKTTNLICMHLKYCKKNPKNRSIMDVIRNNDGDPTADEQDVDIMGNTEENDEDGDPFLLNARKATLPESVSCAMCYKKFNVHEPEQNLHIHMYNDHKVKLPDELGELLEDKYCGECDQYIITQTQKHFESHRKVTSRYTLKHPTKITCDYLGCMSAKMLYKNEAIKHFREVHGNDQTENTMCSKEYLLRCNFCDEFTTYSEVLYTIHMTNKHQFRPIYPTHRALRFCPRDGCYFIGMKCHVELHLTEEHNEHDNNILCKFCDELFTSKKDMHAHVKEIHKDEILDDQLMCEDCGQIFKYQISLYVHENRFHLPSGDMAIEPYFCNQCQQIFQKYINYKTHQYNRHRIPMPEDLKVELKDHYCNVCDVYLRKNAKNCLHQKMSTPSEYFCDKCGKVCNNRLSFSIHYQRAHQERELKCKFENCGHKCRDPDDLNMHSILHHHGAQPDKLECEYCRKQFTQRYILNRHLRSKHQAEPRNISKRGRPPKVTVSTSLSQF